MQSVTLTDLSIKGLLPRGNERYEVFDSKVPGFAVRVFPSGIKSFVLLYRQQGRLRRMTLGRYPVISLSEARRLAQRALNSVAHGSDPQQSKTEARNGIAFGETVDTFIATHCARFNRARTAHETARILRSQFVVRWDARDVRDIARADVIVVLDRIVAIGASSAANNALAAIRKFFNWAIERGLIDTNPCVGLKKPAPHRSRDRVLSDGELAQVFRAAIAEGYPYGAIVALLILTAQRRGEVTEMRWSEIDFDKATWTIPAARTKSNRMQVLPLVPQALATLAAVPRFNDDRVFPAQAASSNSFSGFSRAKKRLDEVSGVTQWVVHDLRRTAATGMARLGVAPHVVERILNHTSGTLGGVAGVYNRFGYLPEMRTALDQWAAHVSAVQNGT